MEIVMKFNKQSIADAFIVAFIWLVSLSLIYLVVFKIKILLNK